MEKTGEYTLWSDHDRENFFLVPGDEELSTGSLEIETTGNSMQVSSEELNRFAVSREEARQWLKSEFAAVIEEAKKEILNTLARDRSEPPEWSVAAKRKRRGQQEGAVASEEAAARKKHQINENNINRAGRQNGWDALTGILDELGVIVERSIARENEPPDDTRAQADELRKLLEGHGLDIKENPETFFERLQEWLSAQEDAGGLQESADRLEMIADGIDSAAGKSSKRLRSMAEAMRRRCEDDPRMTEKTIRGSDASRVSCTGQDMIRETSKDA